MKTLHFGYPRCGVAQVSLTNIDFLFKMIHNLLNCLASGIGVAFLSYNGGIRLTATIDKKIVPSHEQADLLTKCINQEIQDLRGIVSLGENIV